MLRGLQNAGADFEAELARHMHLMDDLFLDVLDRRIQAAEKYQAKEREVLEGLQLIR